MSSHDSLEEVSQRLRPPAWKRSYFKFSFWFIIIIASHPCQGIGHRQTSSTHPCLELSCLEPPTSCQHLSFLFPCIFSMSPVAYPCLSSPADSTKEPILALPSASAYFRLYWYLSSSFSQLFISYFIRFKSFLKHLLTNTWSLFMTPCVV